jgi:pseudouridine synthase
VGRLDYWTEGLLVLTTDGELAYRLTHPRYHVSKSYLVKVTGTPQPRKIKELEKGIELEDGKTAPAAVEIVRTVGPSSWLLITITEGRNRVVRRMVEAIGHRTLKLKRVGFGGLGMKGLDVGRWRTLSRGEIDHLKRVVSKEPVKPRLSVSYQVREAVADALRLPKPERPQREQRVRGRDEEGRPFRAKGWARPKAKAERPGSAGPRRKSSKGRGRGGGGK